MKVIVLLGPPGSGKGTQADRLQEELDLEYLGTGNLLRDRKEKDDFTGNKIAQVMDKGNRVPTPVVFKIWMEKLEEFKHDSLKGFIIDGSPRTVREAKMLEEALDWYNWEDKRIIFIDVSQEESTERLLHRRICKDCGEIYPYTKKYRDMNKCEECGGELFTREDDDEEGIEQRWDWYRKEVEPVIDYYEEKGLLKRVDGEQSIEDVYEDVLEAAK
ncbi:MAG: nucleoside monophosphate kinase [Candidatus Paceibacterota bacterium]